METCENCGDKIGKLETPRIWNNAIVCEKCETKLKEQNKPQAVANSQFPQSSQANPLLKGAAFAANVVAVFAALLGILAAFQRATDMTAFCFVIAIIFGIVGAVCKSSAKR